MEKDKYVKITPVDYKTKPLIKSISMIAKAVTYTALAVTFLYLPACSSSKNSGYSSGYGTRERCIEKKIRLKYQRFVAQKMCR